MHRLGIQEAVLTAKHGCGFLLWPSATKLPDGSPYSYHVGNSDFDFVIDQADRDSDSDSDAKTKTGVDFFSTRQPDTDTNQKKSKGGVRATFTLTGGNRAKQTSASATTNTNVLQEFSETMEREGIGHGFYYSLTNNFFLNVRGHQVQPPSKLLPGQQKVTQVCWFVG